MSEGDGHAMRRSGATTGLFAALRVMGAAGVIRAVVSQFGGGGTDALENPVLFQVPAVRAAGGITALRDVGEPVEVVREAKRRVFAA